MARDDTHEVSLRKPEGTQSGKQSAEFPSATQPLGWPMFAATGPLSPMLGFMQTWNSSLGATITEFHAEWIDFLKRRLNEDVKLQRRLAYCKSPDEIQTAVGAFYQKLTEDYQKEFTDLMKLTTGILNDGSTNVEPMSRQTRTNEAA